MKCRVRGPRDRVVFRFCLVLLFLVLIVPESALSQPAPAAPAAGAGEQVGKAPRGSQIDLSQIPGGPAKAMAAERQAAEQNAPEQPAPEAHRWIPPLWSVAGFVIMLLCIAVIPLADPHWWEHNKNKAIVTAVLGIPVGIYVVAHDGMALVHNLHDYEQFIILLLSLFVISGGIWLSGDVRATPRNNVTFLAIGSVLASFIGTTGAAMVLIRPLLSSNSERKYVMHTVIFFIFLAANIGGLLTPLGDPPLFMGYLKGVSFTWTFRLWHIWLPTCVFLLIVYFILDTYFWGKESEAAKEWDAEAIQPLKLKGIINILLLLGVVACIYFYPNMAEFIKEKFNLEESVVEWIPIREVIMLLLTYLSWKFTRIEYRKAQNFTWNPIIEVAVLFLGIFVTMIPALILLNEWGPRSPIQHPWHFFWTTGGLSSFLDNTPTYLTFFALGLGQCGAGCPDAYTLAHHGGYISQMTLMAISVGAVFMGANTYIGNAPNFMVKSIAEENKVKMPSFFGYMAWSVGILVPTFIAITFIYFRH